VYLPQTISSNQVLVICSLYRCTRLLVHGVKVVRLYTNWSSKSTSVSWVFARERCFRGSPRCTAVWTTQASEQAVCTQPGTSTSNKSNICNVVLTPLNRCSATLNHLTKQLTITLLWVCTNTKEDVNLITSLSSYLQVRAYLNFTQQKYCTVCTYRFCLWGEDRDGRPRRTVPSPSTFTITSSSFRSEYGNFPNSQISQSTTPRLHTFALAVTCQNTTSVTYVYEIYAVLNSVYQNVHKKY